MPDYVMTEEDLPEEYQEQKSQNGGLYEKSMREMANKLPMIFIGEKWDKWRDKKNEKSWREQHLTEYEDIPF